jgi:Kef-type K+ transport system membrane component KefB
MDLSFLPDWPPVWPAAVAVAVLALFAAAAGEAAARWLRVPRLLGYLAAGAVFGAAGYLLQLLQVEPLPTRTLHFSMDVAAAVILFDLGQRVSFGWIRRNPALLGASVLESALSFAGVFAVMRVLDFAPLPSALIAAISMSTSPAVLLAVTREMRAQGQVTERTLLITALNSLRGCVDAAASLGARGDARRAGRLPAAPGVADRRFARPGGARRARVPAGGGVRRARTVGPDPCDARGRLDRICQRRRVAAVATAGAARLRGICSHLRPGTPARTTDFGLASGVALTLFFALSAAVVDGSALFGAWMAALALTVVRVVCKVGAVGVLAPLTGISLRKGLLTGLGLLPMSATAIMLTQQISQLNPQLGAQTSSVLLASVLILQVFGTLTLMLALRASGEARAER